MHQSHCRPPHLTTRTRPQSGEASADAANQDVTLVSFSINTPSSDSKWRDSSGRSAGVEGPIRSTGHRTPGAGGEVGIRLALPRGRTGHERSVSDECRVGNHALCSQIPGDREGTHASLPGGTNPEKEHSQQELRDGQRRRGQRRALRGHHREVVEKPVPFILNPGLPLHLVLLSARRMCFLRGLVCFNLSVILFPLQFLLHST